MQHPSKKKHELPNWVRIIGTAWGLLGVALILIHALVKLIPFALQPFETGLPAWQWGLYGLVTFSLAYSEGYRGFQKGFSPRLVLRAFALKHHATPTRIVLAPLFCMGLFGATRRRLTSMWILTAFIIGAILAVRLLPYPYRSIVDGGVVVGLGWGLTSVLVFLVKTLAGSPPSIPLDIPLPHDSQK